MSAAPVIRIVKKKAGHAGHHGGAWKVAYADFVTAMMAFFLVMWIISMDQPTRQKIQDYFQDPFSTSEKGISSLASGGMTPTATGFFGIMNGRGARGVSSDKQTAQFKRIKRKVEKEIVTHPELSRFSRNVEMSLNDGGMNIELVERKDSLFFERGSSLLPAPARRLLLLIGHELSRVRNHIVLEGHTDVVPYSGQSDYTNWELSSDRANAARRMLEAGGLRPDQVLEVRGFADRALRDSDHPGDASNRRVSIQVQYSHADPDIGAATPRLSPAERPAFEVDIKPSLHGPRL